MRGCVSLSLPASRGLVATCTPVLVTVALWVGSPELIFFNCRCLGRARSSLSFDFDVNYRTARWAYVF